MVSPHLLDYRYLTREDLMVLIVHRTLVARKAALRMLKLTCNGFKTKMKMDFTPKFYFYFSPFMFLSNLIAFF